MTWMANRGYFLVTVVDDSSEGRTGQSILMRTFNSSELFVTARDGAEVVRLCTEVHPDVVLMDLVTPGVHGVSTTRVIRCDCPPGCG